MTDVPPNSPDSSRPRSPRGPLLAVILLLVVIVGLLGSAVVLGLRFYQSGSDDVDGPAASPTGRAGIPDVPSAPTRSPLPTRARTGVMLFQVVEEQRPLASENPCTGKAWTEFEQQCLRLGGGLLAEVTAEAMRQDGNPVIQIVLHPPADRSLASFTEKHQGDRIALVAGDQVLTAPTISGPVTDGRVQIYGTYTMAEAEELAAAINSA